MENEAECPLCQHQLPSLTSLRRHLGKHHEELSLFALPSHMNDQQNEPDETGFDVDSRSLSSVAEDGQSPLLSPIRDDLLDYTDDGNEPESQVEKRPPMLSDVEPPWPEYSEEYPHNSVEAIRERKPRDEVDAAPPGVAHLSNPDILCDVSIAHSPLSASPNLRIGRCQAILSVHNGILRVSLTGDGNKTEYDEWSTLTVHLEDFSVYENGTISLLGIQNVGSGRTEDLNLTAGVVAELQEINATIQAYMVWARLQPTTELQNKASMRLHVQYPPLDNVETDINYNETTSEIVAVEEAFNRHGKVSVKSAIEAAPSPSGEQDVRHAPRPPSGTTFESEPMITSAPDDTVPSATKLSYQNEFSDMNIREKLEEEQLNAPRSGGPHEAAHPTDPEPNGKHFAVSILDHKTLVSRDCTLYTQSTSLRLDIHDLNQIWHMYYKDFTFASISKRLIEAHGIASRAPKDEAHKRETWEAELSIEVNALNDRNEIVHHVQTRGVVIQGQGLLPTDSASNPTAHQETDSAWQTRKILEPYNVSAMKASNLLKTYNVRASGFRHPDTSSVAIFNHGELWISTTYLHFRCAEPSDLQWHIRYCSITTVQNYGNWVHVVGDVGMHIGASQMGNRLPLTKSAEVSFEAKSNEEAMLILLAIQEAIADSQGSELNDDGHQDSKCSPTVSNEGIPRFERERKDKGKSLSVSQNIGSQKLIDSWNVKSEAIRMTGAMQEPGLRRQIDESVSLESSIMESKDVLQQQDHFIKELQTKDNSDIKMSHDHGAIREPGAGQRNDLSNHDGPASGTDHIDHNAEDDEVERATPESLTNVRTPGEEALDEDFLELEPMQRFLQGAKDIMEMDMRTFLERHADDNTHEEQNDDKLAAEMLPDDGVSSIERPDDSIIEECFAELVQRRGWDTLPREAREQMDAYSLDRKWTLLYQDAKVKDDTMRKRIDT